jgi:amylosucrase
LATLKGASSQDLLTDETVEMNASPLLLEPFQQMWLLAD